MKKFIFIFFVTGAILSGCYYDSEEALWPTLPGSCDTTSVSFATDISPILGNYCLSCHSNTAAPTSGNNIKLEDYADVASHADAVLGSVKHEAAYSPMPKGGGNLIECDINKLEAWINQGKLDN